MVDWLFLFFWHGTEALESILFGKDMQMIMYSEIHNSNANTKKGRSALDHVSLSSLHEENQYVWAMNI